MKKVTGIFAALLLCSCVGNGGGSSAPEMSEKSRILYEKAQKKVEAVAVVPVTEYYRTTYTIN